MLIVVSQVVVVLLGVTITVLAAWGMFVPEKLMAMVASTMNRDWGIYFAVFVRLVMGVALILIAPGTPMPVVFSVLGWIALAAALGVAVVGRERIRRLMAWWADRVSASVTRLWLLFGMAFGVFLVYGVLWTRLPGATP